MPVASPQDEMGRRYRRYPLWPISGIPSEWINKEDPNYQESIFQGPEYAVDITGTGTINEGVAKPGKWWYSKLKEVLASPELSAARKMKGGTLLNKLRSGGVSKEELRWTGIQDTIKEAGQNYVPMESVRDLAERNKISIRDFNLGEGLKSTNQKLAKIRDTAHHSYDSARSVLGEHYNAAFEMNRPDFVDYINKASKRLTPNDRELAELMGKSRIEYINWQKNYLLKARDSLEKHMKLGSKADDSLYLVEEKKRTHHQGYFIDRPLPKGEKYREYLVRLNKPGVKVGGGIHYPSYKNIVVGSLADQRRTVEGKLAMHMQEYQNDWSQKIRKHGVIPKINPKLVEKEKALTEVSRARFKKWENLNAVAGSRWDKYVEVRDRLRNSGKDPWDDLEFLTIRDQWSSAADSSRAAREQYLLANESLENLRERIPKKKPGQMPDMPFQDTEALKLGLKKTLYEAAKENVDVFTWSTGEQVHKRWQRGTDVKWPFKVYDEFTPNTVKSLGRELGVNIEVKEMRYPTGGRQRQDLINDIQTLTERYNRIVELGNAPHTTRILERMIRKRKELLKNVESEGHKVWGIDMTPELKKKILEKGFKISKKDSSYKQLKEMLA